MILLPDVDRKVDRLLQQPTNNSIFVYNSQDFLTQINNVPNENLISVEAIISREPDNEEFFIKNEWRFWQQRLTTPYINKDYFGALARITPREAYAIAEKYLNCLANTQAKGTFTEEEKRKVVKNTFAGEITTKSESIYPTWKFLATYKTNKRN